MVRIISGENNSGKSTTFLRMYRKKNNEAGLYSGKLYSNDGVIIGYNLVFLPIWEEIPFISLKGLIPQKVTNDYHFQGRFAFLKETFKIAERYILNYSTNEPVWIDEVGRLELKGVGYNTLLSTLLKSGRDITFTVRSDLLEKVIEKYKIKKYSLIEASENGTSFIR